MYGRNVRSPYLADFFLHLYTHRCNENSIKFSFNAITNCTHTNIHFYNFSSSEILSCKTSNGTSFFTRFLLYLPHLLQSRLSFSFRTLHVIIRHETYIFNHAEKNTTAYTAASNWNLYYFFVLAAISFSCVFTVFQTSFSLNFDMLTNKWNQFTFKLK